MATSLLIPRKRGRSVNFGNAVILIGALVAVGVMAAFGIARLNQAPPSTAPSGGPNGAQSHASAYSGEPVTAPRVPSDDSSQQPRSYYAGLTRTDSTTPRTAHTFSSVRRSVPSTTTEDLQRPEQARSTNSGNAPASSSRTDSSSDVQIQQAADEARHQRAYNSSRSMGGVAFDSADASRADEPSAATSSAPSSSTAPPALSNTSNARLLMGPILPIDAKIPVSMVATIDSTFGGQLDATVTEDVYDERQKRVLIPAQSHCYAKATSGGVDGQARVYVSFDLCKRPDFQRIALADFPAVDLDGATGLKARVDDHGAGRHARSNVFMTVPSMLAGTVMPGVGGMVASSAMSGAQQSSIGHAVPGPTLYVDASPEKPRSFFILVIRDTSVGGQ